MYVPLGVFAANVIIPFTFIDNGPFTAGVTSVLFTVTTTPFKVSFPITDPEIIIGVEPVATTIGVLSTASKIFLTITVAVAVSQFTGFAPASHN